MTKWRKLYKTDGGSCTKRTLKDRMEAYKEQIDGIRTYLASGKYTPAINTAMVKRNVRNQKKTHTLNGMTTFFSIISSVLPTFRLMLPRCTLLGATRVVGHKQSCKKKMYDTAVAPRLMMSQVSHTRGNMYTLQKTF